MNNKFVLSEPRLCNVQFSKKNFLRPDETGRRRLASVIFSLTEEYDEPLTLDMSNFKFSQETWSLWENSNSVASLVIKIWLDSVFYKAGYINRDFKTGSFCSPESVRISPLWLSDLLTATNISQTLELQRAGPQIY